VFTGEYRHSVDEKGRLAVPARFRAQLEGGAFIAKWVDGCLAIFTRAEWDELARRVGSLPLSDANARNFSRFVFSSAFDFELDRQGRLVVPATLRSWAGLEADAVVVGARDHAEVWSPARWDEYQSRISTAEALAENLSGLPI
jgi:MraZ protein